MSNLYPYTHTDAMKKLGLSEKEYKMELKDFFSYPLNKCRTCEELFETHPDAEDNTICCICEDIEKRENRDAYGIETVCEDDGEED